MTPAVEKRVSAYNYKLIFRYVAILQSSSFAGGSKYSIIQHLKISLGFSGERFTRRQRNPRSFSKQLN